MAQVDAKAVQAGVIIPRAGDGDLPGYAPKPMLEKTPFVKDKAGMIWHWQTWMADMGDVLEPCWEAPPERKIQVPTLLDRESFGRPPGTGSEAAQKPDAPSPSVLTSSEKSVTGKRKGGRSKGTPRA